MVAHLHAGTIVSGLAGLDAGRFVPPDETGLLILCFTNRCGSNYLAGLLASTGAFNEAGEYFNADVVLRQARMRGLGSLRVYVSALPSIILGDQDWLVAKASIDQLIMLADAGVLDQHPRVRYLLLERQDSLGQAISRCIAAQNDRWTAAQRAERSDADLVYDRDAIALTMRDVATANEAFRSFFAVNGLEAIHLCYEDLVRDPALAVRHVGDSLGLAGLVPDPVRVSVAAQAGQLNRVWRSKFQDLST